MKDIYSPLEIDEQWDQRAPMDGDGATVAVDEPMMAAQTDPHAQDLHSDSPDTADTSTPQATPPAAPAEPSATPVTDNPAPASDDLPTAQPAADDAADEAATIDANMAHMGQTVFEPQFKPQNSDDDAAAKMMGSDVPTTPVSDQPAADEPVAPAEPAAPTPEPPAEPEPATPTIDEMTSSPSTTMTPPSIDDESVVEDVDKDVHEMITKLESESQKLDQDIAEKNEQILTMQKEIDAHNTKKAAVQKRIDGLKAVIG